MVDNKNLTIIGGLHGNEKVGVRVIEKLGKIVDGKKIIGIAANPKALRENRRFIDQDLNRSFPGKKNGNYEERLAYRLCPKLAKFDYVLDLHSFSCQSEPFAILTRKSRSHLKLAKASGVEKIVFMLPKLASGRALIDHCQCGVSIEAGRHGLENTFNRAECYARNILKFSGLLPGMVETPKNLEYFEIIDVFYKNKNQKLALNIVNFRLVAKDGLMARGKDGNLKAPYDFYPILAREKAYPDILCLVAKRVNI